MESIDKLRTAARNMAKGSNLENHDECNLLLIIADEIADNYMRLPVDANNEPIHVGDVLECDANGYKGTFTVFAIGNNTVVGNHDIEWIRDNPSKWFHVASFCCHVKPRTLEDVLTDRINDVLRVMTSGIPIALETALNDSFGEECADEIRELMGGDAE